MNAPTILAIVSPAVGVLIAIIGGLFALSPNRASAAASYAQTAIETNKELRLIKDEVRGIKVAVEEMVDVVRVDVLPLIEGDHPQIARKLTVVKAKVEAVI